MQQLTDLLKSAGLAEAVVGAAENPFISSISSDSRDVVAGGLFVAIAGAKNNGAAYANAAVQQGAVTVVTEDPSALHLPHSVAVVHVPDARRAVAKLAAALYAPQPQYCVAITGTDGKTSTADFVRQLAGFLGLPAASLGTLGLCSPFAEMNTAFPANNTSPEPVLLHRTLEELAMRGVQHVAIEASSHGIDQGRVEGVRFAAAAYTNLTRDHLDYHGTVEAYAAAKERLFSELLPVDGTAVLNLDDAACVAMQHVCRVRGIRVIGFGRSEAAEYRILSVTPHAQGVDAVLRIHGAEHAVSLPLYGAFQLQNMLAAMGLLAATGIAESVVLPLLPRLQGVSGRLEKIGETAQGCPVFIDYAHTPAALENILKTLRPHTQHKLHVVFGCGGDRDAGKRPEMGRAAMQYADAVIITDDNPRSEDPASIRAAIRTATPAAQEIADRAEAIRVAVQQLTQGDLLVVAGKGHETTQIVGKQVIHFSDAQCIREVLGTP